MTLLEEALDSKLKSPGDRRKTKVTITAITSKSAVCVSKVVCLGTLFSQLYSRPLTTLTEMVRDNRSYTVYLIACSPSMQLQWLSAALLR